MADAQAASGVGSALNPRAVAHEDHGDSESIRVGSVEYRSAGRSGSAGHEQSFEGPPPENETDVLQVCGTLREALSRRGEHWGPFEVPDRVDDVDAFARDGNKKLDAQVTRVEREAWRELARTGSSDARRSPDELAEEIRAAVEHKSSQHGAAQRGALLLALDASRSPGHVLTPVVVSFLERHGEWATGLGYRGSGSLARQQPCRTSSAESGSNPRQTLTHVCPLVPVLRSTCRQRGTHPRYPHRGRAHP